MQGVKNIISGLIFMAGGGGIFMAVNLRGMLAWGVWGLIAVGAVMLAFGLYQAFILGTATVDAGEAYRSSSTARLLMQSMLTTALADGHLDDIEVKTIANACEEVVHEHLDPESIRRIAELVEEKGDAIMEEIRYEGKMLNLDARKAVIGACALVLMSNGKIDTRKTVALNAIGEQLDFSAFETQAFIVEAMEAAKG